MSRPHKPRMLSRLKMRQRVSDARALGHDIATYGLNFLKALISKPARRTYVGLTAIAFCGIIYMAVQMAHTTLKEHGDHLSSATTIMNEKNTGTTIVDRNGEVLFQAYGAVDRHSIPLEEMPTSLKQATLATEDPSFYDHAGFSVRGTARAAYQDLRHKATVQGGSTITQQLVKNTLLTNEKSFTRKYKELVLATELERRYSKDQILQMYLNTVYYGQGAYGAEAASETYFHKPAKDLTLEESALLAGLPQSPSHYDPNVDIQAATARRNYVLVKMQERNYISPQVASSTATSPVNAGTRKIVLKAPHFVFYVLDQLREQYGQDAIEKGGIVVHTTLDYQKQLQAEDIVRTQVGKLASHHVSNGGLVSIDPTNGDIMNMVGSVDYSNPAFGAVNVTTSELQPGSSFKPITYATAFTKGWNGATEVDDKPMSIPDGNGTTYTPQNYDLKFRGPVTLRRALSNSLNIPALKVQQFAGISDTVNMAHTLGVSASSLDSPDSYGISLALGSAEVKPIDMARVYASFDNQGKTVTPRAITKVSDRFGKDITKPKVDVSKQVLDPRIAYMVTNILSDTEARKEEFGPNSPLQLSRPAAAKTGTTNDFRDNWTIGYTPDLVTAVWVGNNDHTPMNNVDGVTGAAPIWHSYMEMMHTGKPVKTFAVPTGITTARVCNTDGGLVDAKDPKGSTEVFLAEAQPTKKCGWNKTTPVLASAQTPATPLTPTQPQVAQAPATPAIEGGRGGGTGGGSTPGSGGGAGGSGSGDPTP